MTPTQTIPHQNQTPYYGRILNGPYGNALKKQISQCITTFTRLEHTDSPAMLYIAAWKGKEHNIWYEHMCTKISSLLRCHPSDTADAFCKSVMESRVYRYGDREEATDIQKALIDQNSLNCERTSLRKESVSAGVTEAVYKIKLHGDRYIWLNDKASIEKYREDDIYVSLGSLTDVTKEMKAEEEREKLLGQLQEALKKVRILTGLLPICASCKQIRDDQGYWNQIEDYISKYADVQFSHGICPDCARKLYPDLFDDE